ncbi:hypothetical protein EHI8A_127670 [Entamoeba histolytica HM-1:IMSS-B]|uniref:TLDc domain-containing protein n=6 Tax=Entamoeba histolytica TaxID=5759 RepID=C4M347_ENTH1|nr:hypothetical protein EHI_059890 [Entamoeba histolytica HM-1:IMSS]EMD43528.1 Hypothetical protein EHI5A_145440 [Entamoeba histolytica KU27]EMH76811.1 hypothetical protein EHI8A_127670 [Entamoeba histolytica HM-1:IMSS-B]EMS16391.1 hypothetical protein KM1_211810 [Entamoeba histolytica HM-3:IMSS]ENY62240.1 hypothetical protein EHI7A_116730 [Entamoeba histolytica HM-1:IMSS-A]GAT95728.1 hypothetical protein CL6EHI_059890 [Entamoeba histolytica]|eukprot:XP_652894.1 hypothetical protein EHI_059890 [Entamoeba histolytica HM-1:IMSS]
MKTILDSHFFDETEKFFEAIEPYLISLENKRKPQPAVIEEDTYKRIDNKRKEFNEIIKEIKQTTEFISFCDYLSDKLKWYVENQLKRAKEVKEDIMDDIETSSTKDKTVNSKELLNLCPNTDLNNIIPWKTKSNTQTKTKKTKKAKKTKKTKKNNKVIDDSEIKLLQSDCLKKWTGKKQCEEIYNSEKLKFDGKEMNEKIKGKKNLAFVVMNESDMFGCYLEDKVDFDHWIYDEHHFAFSFAHKGELSSVCVYPKQKVGMKLNSNNSKILFSFGNEETGSVTVSTLKEYGETKTIKECYEFKNTNDIFDSKFKVEQIIIYELLD